MRLLPKRLVFREPFGGLHMWAQSQDTVGQKPIDGPPGIGDKQVGSQIYDCSTSAQNRVEGATGSRLRVHKCDSTRIGKVLLRIEISAERANGMAESRSQTINQSTSSNFGSSYLEPVENVHDVVHLRGLCPNMF